MPKHFEIDKGELQIMIYDEYLAIKNCKYQCTVPSINTEELHVLCTREVDIKELKHPVYKYAHLCSTCVGYKCKYKAESVSM